MRSDRIPTTDNINVIILIRLNKKISIKLTHSSKPEPHLSLIEHFIMTWRERYWNRLKLHLYQTIHSSRLRVLSHFLDMRTGQLDVQNIFSMFDQLDGVCGHK
jgi:hypothetical protein